MSAQDVGDAQESLDAKFEGTRADRRVQPAVPARRGRRGRHRRGRARDDRPAEAGRRCAAADSGDFLYLLMPVRTSDLSRRVCDPLVTRSVTLAQRFPLLRASTSSCAPDGLTVLLGANGQGKTSLLEAVGWVATARSFRGRARRGARAHRVRRRRSCAPRSSTTSAGSCSRPSSASVGRNRVLLQPAAVDARARSARAAARHGVRARRPRSW